MTQLRMRQVHLDYHTAGQIAGVGADWDAAHFIETLQRAHVNSITCFARCHHGYTYYLPTRYKPHPALTFNLLGAQIEACHKAGIRAPIYVTVGWDELVAHEHPEWLQVSPEGLLGGSNQLEARWKDICFNSPYLDYVWGQVEEIVDLFGTDVDGFFFDIIHQRECLCPRCVASMQRAGLDPTLAADRRRFSVSIEDAYRRRFGGGVLAMNPNWTVFHNAGHIHASIRPTLDTFSHLELESLPSTGMWGYNHFPITVRYARTLGKPMLGMTGKFHTSWGDFCSYKSQAALEFECFQMLATGAACSIGDQLHPRARLDEPVYELIGKVYAGVEAKEPWCIGAVPQAEIGVMHVEAVGTDDGRVDTSMSGVLRMLMEAHHQFDVVDDQTDWSGYRLIVLPDKIPVNAALAKKIEAYLQGGGKLIATDRAGLTPEGDAFAVDAIGLDYLGAAAYSPEYLHPLPELGAPLADTLYVMYDQGQSVRCRPGTQSLAELTGSYFNRTYAHFCSHRQTPPDPDQPLEAPGMTINAAGNVIYISHPLFLGYRRQAVPWYKKLFLAAVNLLLPDPMVVTSAPSTAQVNVTTQASPQRTIVHLLHYIPERRGLEFDTIEDVIPLHDVALSFRAPQPGRVYLAPEGTDVPFTYEDGAVNLIVPAVVGHQMVVAE